MGLFSRFSKNNKELDCYLCGVANNMANNYKDAAQEDFKKFVEKFDEFKAACQLTDKQIAFYENIKMEYEQKLKGFHH